MLASWAARLAFATETSVEADRLDSSPRRTMPPTSSRNAWIAAGVFRSGLAASGRVKERAIMAPPLTTAARFWSGGTAGSWTQHQTCTDSAVTNPPQGLPSLFVPAQRVTASLGRGLGGCVEVGSREGGILGVEEAVPVMLLPPDARLE